MKQANSSRYNRYAIALLGAAAAGAVGMGVHHSSPAAPTPAAPTTVATAQQPGQQQAALLAPPVGRRPLPSVSAVPYHVTEYRSVMERSVPAPPPTGSGIGGGTRSAWIRVKPGAKWPPQGPRVRDAAHVVAGVRLNTRAGDGDGVYVGDSALSNEKVTARRIIPPPRAQQHDKRRKAGTTSR